MSNSLKKELGSKITFYRLRANMTRKDLCELTGIPTTSLANYEQGHREPSIAILEKISKALKINIRNLVDFNKTYGQKIIEYALSQGMTLDSISKNADIPLAELINIAENNNEIDSDMYIKLFKYLNISNNDLDILSIRANDYFQTCTYIENESPSEEISQLLSNSPINATQLSNIFISKIEDNNLRNFLFKLNENKSNSSNYRLFLIKELLNDLNLDKNIKNEDDLDELSNEIKLCIELFIFKKK